MASIELLRKLEEEKRLPGSDEKKVLARYTGRGWAGEHFSPTNPRYAKEYAWLQANLSEEEFASARRSTLNAHFTSAPVIGAMWTLARRLGLRPGAN